MADKHDCGCGCEHEEADVITLEFEDENGKIEEIECEPLGIFEVEGKEYCALVPVDEESDDVYLYEYKEAGDEFELLDIEDDDLYERVVAEFENILEEADAMEEK